MGRADTLKPQLYSWEWVGGVQGPHVHIRRGDPTYHGLGKLHIPTGRVFFEAVLLFLLQEHHVTARRGGAVPLLEDVLRRVSQFSSWGGLSD